jgi:GT2 family glycosyltransferase
MRSAVYIPTRKREEQLQKVIESFLPHPVDIFIVTEDQFVPKVEKALAPCEFEVDIIPTENNCGIGSARDLIVSDAAEEGYESIIQCDDDNRLVKDTDVVGMLRFAKRQDVVGVGAWKSTYSLFTGRTEMTWAAKEKKQSSLSQSWRIRPSSLCAQRQSCL